MDWNRHQRGQIDVGTDHIKTRESPDGWRRNLGSFFEFAFGHFLGLSNLGLGSEFVKVGVQKWQFPETSKKCQFDVFFAIWPNSGFRVKFDQILGSMDPWWPEVKTPNSESRNICMYLSRFMETVKTWHLTSQIPNYDRPQISHRSVVVLQDTTAVRTNRSAGIFDRSDRTSTITQFLVEWRRCETRLPMLTLLVDDDASQRGK